MQITDLDAIEQQTGDGPPNIAEPTPIDWSSALTTRRADE